MYVIKTNQVKDYYLGFTKKSYKTSDPVIKQDSKIFAMYFDTKEKAQKALERYFETGKVAEKNKKYFTIIEANDVDNDNLIEITVRLDDSDNKLVCRGLVKVRADSYYYFIASNGLKEANTAYEKYLATK